MAAHVGSHFGSHPVAQEPGFCLLNRTSDWRERDRGTPVPATELVKIANALDLTVFFLHQRGRLRSLLSTAAELLEAEFKHSRVSGIYGSRGPRYVHMVWA
jgi:hypothetical protein